ncbi:MAG: hypothetical protein C0418_03530, partial [Coriobacteriaceae bacterium]|nr:hypothetical protein [Coriobacteriaceae bacterium]
DAVRRSARYMDMAENATTAYTPVLRLYCTHRETVDHAARAGVPTRREFVTDFRKGVDEIVDLFDTALIAEHSETVSTADVPETSPPEWCRCGAFREAGT